MITTHARTRMKQRGLPFWYSVPNPITWPGSTATAMPW